MTMKVADIAPKEAQLAEISERLSAAATGSRRAASARDLALDADYLDAAKLMLAALSRDLPAPSVDAEPLTEEEVSAYLDFDPAFAEVAKNMLRDFILRTEAVRKQGRPN